VDGTTSKNGRSAEESIKSPGPRSADSKEIGGEVLLPSPFFSSSSWRPPGKEKAKLSFENSEGDRTLKGVISLNTPTYDLKGEGKEEERKATPLLSTYHRKSKLGGGRTDGQKSQE